MTLNPKLLVCAPVTLVCVGALISPGSAVRSQDNSQATQTRIATLFRDARQAEEGRELQKAARLYDQILTLDPRLAEVWTNKGLVLHELSKHREAQAAFQKAAALKPQLLTPQLFLGIEYLKRGEPQKAVRPLQSALALQPHHPQATYELANAYARLEQFERARRLYLELIQRDPKMEQAWYGLGIAYLNWSKSAARKLTDAPTPSPYGKILLAELQAVGGILLDAEANYRSAVETMPSSVEARLALGRFYLDFQRTPEGLRQAEEQFAQAEALASLRDPRVELAWVRLALRQEDISQACAHLNQALAADLPFSRKHLADLTVGLPPETVRRIIAGLRPLQAATAQQDTVASAAVAALMYAALTELSQVEQAEAQGQNFEQFAQAIEALQVHRGARSYSGRLAHLDEDERSRLLSVAERLELAEYAWNLGDYGRALQATLDVRRKTRSDQALYWLSLACRGLARETFLQALKINPDSYRAHLLLADLANDRHNVAQALAEYEQAVTLGAGDPEVHLLLVQFLISKGRDQEALAKGQAAVERFPAHPALNSEVGALLLKMRKPQEAAQHFQKALEADSGPASARVGLADCYAALGDSEKAIQEMKRALPADLDGSYHYRLGRWYQKLGLRREAQDAFAVSTKLKQGKLRRDSERFLKSKPVE